jgi:hypothetical protein
MKTRKNGGGTCTTYYCTNKEMNYLALEIRSDILKSMGINSEYSDKEDRSNTPIPTKLEIEEYVKKHCNKNNGSKQCFDPIGTRNFMGWYGHNGEKVMGKRIYNKRVSIKEIVDNTHELIKKWFSIDEQNIRRGLTRTNVSQSPMTQSPMPTYKSQMPMPQMPTYQSPITQSPMPTYQSPMPMPQMPTYQSPIPMPQMPTYQSPITQSPMPQLQVSQGGRLKRKKSKRKRL